MATIVEEMAGLFQRGLLSPDAVRTLVTSNYTGFTGVWLLLKDEAAQESDLLLLPEVYAALVGIFAEPTAATLEQLALIAENIDLPISRIVAFRLLVRCAYWANSHKLVTVFADSDEGLILAALQIVRDQEISERYDDVLAYGQGCLIRNDEVNLRLTYSVEAISALFRSGLMPIEWLAGMEFIRQVLQQGRYREAADAAALAFIKIFEENVDRVNVQRKAVSELKEALRSERKPEWLWQIVLKWSILSVQERVWLLMRFMVGRYSCDCLSCFLIGVYSPMFLYS